MKRQLMVLAGAVALVSAAPAPAYQEELYLLSYDLYDGGQMIGSPQLMVTKDHPATVTVEGPHGYTLSATLLTTRDATKEVAVVASEISLPGEGGPIKIAAPIMAIPFGAPSRVDIVRNDKPGAEPFRMDVTVNE